MFGVGLDVRTIIMSSCFEDDLTDSVVIVSFLLHHYSCYLETAVDFRPALALNQAVFRSV